MSELERRKKEMIKLTKASTENAIAIAIVDNLGNVIVRYFDDLTVKKDSGSAAIVCDAIAKIMNKKEVKGG